MAFEPIGKVSGSVAPANPILKAAAVTSVAMRLIAVVFSEVTETDFSAEKCSGPFSEVLARSEEICGQPLRSFGEPT